MSPKCLHKRLPNPQNMRVMSELAVGIVAQTEMRTMSEQ
jgi:hypothetical protein